jgi:ADP-ribosylglycohydrolase
MNESLTTAVPPETETETAPTQRARALGALTGLAIGDALGMPTQYLPRETVRQLYGELDWFHDGPEVNIISGGMPAGHVTDDTDQALIVAEALIRGRGAIDPDDLARRLLEWEADMAARGSLDLLGPSTKRALEALTAGTPVGEAGRWGDTNGAAMRIAAVGVATPPQPLTALVDRVVEVSRLTHNTGIAIAGAAAVAAAISAGLDGADNATALRTAVEAARLGARRGEYVAGADVSRRIEWAIALVESVADHDAVSELVSELIGTGVATQEAVPAAFALLSRLPDDPWQVCLWAAGLGGDSDTIAAIAGAMGGSIAGVDAFPERAVSLVRSVNRLDLGELVDGLLELRRQAGGQS